jgi:hypothetical protein
VLIARNHMQDADLVILDRDGRAQRRIDLGADSDPFDIERWGDRLVVADGTRYTLEAVSFDGAKVQGFPPAQFARELDREHRRADFWRDVRTAARIAMVAVPIAAIALLLYL